ncbi:MAG: heme exporter protein CcmB [Blastomonas sp.]
MRALAWLVRRELAFAYGAGRGASGFALPVIFFVAVAAIYPFGVGPDAPLLARTGGGIIWIAALLASILPIDRLVQSDIEHGFMDQIVLRGIGDEMIALAKTIGHWLGFGPPLMLACLASAVLLGQNGTMLWRIEIGLLLATPALAALAVLIAALTSGLRHGAALGGLMLLPLAVPLLIFGAGSLATGGENGLMLLAAASLFITAICPIAAGAALRAARE